MYTERKITWQACNRWAYCTDFTSKCDLVPNVQLPMLWMRHSLTGAAARELKALSSNSLATLAELLTCSYVTSLEFY